MSTRMLAALTTALVLTLAVAGAVTSIAGHGTTAGAHPAQATPPGPTEWHRVDLRSFAVWLPPGWTDEYREGVDSFVGAFVGDGAELVFDYGQTSDPPPDPGTPGYDVTNETIGGKPAKLVVARSAPADLTGVYFADVTRERAGCEHVIVVRLTVVGRDLDAEQQATALAILRSIHFPGPGEWTRVPVPAYPDTLSMSLWDIDMVSADEGWAVGAQYDLEAGAHAAVLHYRDGRWRALRSPSQDILMSVDMVSAGEGWAVGLESIVHYKDGEWKLLKDKAPFMVLDVEMVSPDDGWIVGTDALLRYRDGQWQPQDTPEFGGAVRLNMLSPDEGWSLGGTNADFPGPNFHRFENGTWRSVPWPLPTLSDPQALEMTANPWGTGWLGGANGNRGWLARHCEGRYEPVTTTLPSTVWDIGMLHASGTEGWAVGGDPNASPALLMHFVDDEWTVLDSPYDGYIKAVDMVGRDEGWAVGMYFGPDIMGGALLHYTGPAQPPPPPGSTATATATATVTPTRDAATATPSPTDTPTPPNGHTGIYLPVVSKAHDWAPIRLRGESTGIAAAGDFVYMGDGTHVAVVDVSNPSQPRVTGRVGPPRRGR